MHTKCYVEDMNLKSSCSIPKQCDNPKMYILDEFIQTNKNVLNNNTKKYKVKCWYYVLDYNTIETY